MRNILTGAALALTMLCASQGEAGTPESWQAVKAENKSGASAKLGSALLATKRAYGSKQARAWLPSRMPQIFKLEDGAVQLSAYGKDPTTLATELARKGMLDIKVHAHAVTGRAPLVNLDDIAKSDGLAFIRPALPVPRAGLVTSQGDHAMRSDTARARFGVDGSGIRVGVLSDSFNCTREPFFPDQRFTTAEEDIANADLPQDIRLLEEYRASDCADEGRAMMQIVHDVAPGASLSFHTAYGTQEDFAEGILHLAADGAQILVDDIIYLDEPMFENGVVADAVNAVKKQGKPYFSSAGNEGRRSYQSAFRLTSEQGFDGYRHDFDPGPGIDTLQHIAVAPEGQSIYVVGWDEPSLSANGMKGSRSDIDVIFFNMDGTPVINCDYAPYDAPYCQVIGASFNQDADAVEYAVIANFTDSPLEVQVGIELFAGPAPNLIKGVWFGDEVLVNEYDTRSGTIYGHANAEGAEAVGAAWWFDTAAYGAANHPRCGNACVTYYSSAGGTPILFDDAGERKRVPFLGFKPGVTGPDGGNTTFFYSNETITAPGEPDDFPNFYGTSASAPHVAAVAALMLDQRARDISAHKHFVGPRTLTPDLIYAALRLSAEDIKRRSLAKADPAATEPLNHAQGYDPDSGFGLVNAAKALKLTKGF